MKKEFVIYLESIGLSGTVLGKVEDAYNFYSKFLEYEIKDIFVSEYLNQDGSRVYENLWFFSENFCGEAKFFLTKEDYDSDIIKKSISTFSIKKTDFDIITCTPIASSRLHLTFNFLNGLRAGDMKASKENCKKLSEIFVTYILPNIKNRID